MKLKIFLLAFFFSTSVKLDYTAYTIKELIDKAEIIGKCEIIKVDRKTFTIRFIDIIKGQPSKELTLPKFINWTCASRPIEYKVGQIELIFIYRDENKLRPMGAGNEGEIMMENNNIIYPKYNRGKQNDLIFNYSEVKNAIIYYQKNNLILNKMNREEIKNFDSENKFLKNIIVPSFPYSRD